MKLTRQVGVKFTEAQYTRLEEIARQRGIVIVSALIRSIVVQELFLPTEDSIANTTID